LAAKSEDVDMEDVSSAASDTMAKAAPAATTIASEAGAGVADAVKTAVKEAAKAAATMIKDSDEGGPQEHDEL
jgi:hypothetical protein